MKNHPTAFLPFTRVRAGSGPWKKKGKRKKTAASLIFPFDEGERKGGKKKRGGGRLGNLLYVSSLETFILRPGNNCGKAGEKRKKREDEVRKTVPFAVYSYGGAPCG